MKNALENVSIEKQGVLSILSIRNNLSYQTAGELKTVMDQLGDAPLLIDLEHVRLTTSLGLGALVRTILNVTEAGHRVGLCNLSKQMKLIIDTMDILWHVPVLQLFESCDAGVAALNR